MVGIWLRWVYVLHWTVVLGGGWFDFGLHSGFGMMVLLSTSEVGR